MNSLTILPSYKTTVEAPDGTPRVIDSNRFPLGSNPKTDANGSTSHEIAVEVIGFDAAREVERRFNAFPELLNCLRNLVNAQSAVRSASDLLPGDIARNYYAAKEAAIAAMSKDSAISPGLADRATL